MKKFALENNLITQNKDGVFLTNKGNEYLTSNPILTWKTKDFSIRPEINTELLKILESSNSETAEEKEAYDAAFKVHITEKAQKEAEINSIKKKIAEMKEITDTCPVCKQKLPGATKPDYSALEVTLEILTTELADLNKKITEINTVS